MDKFRATIVSTLKAAQEAVWELEDFLAEYDECQLQKEEDE